MQDKSVSVVRRYLIAGLLVWLPILVTLWVIKFIVELLDKSLSLLPHAYQPSNLFGVNIPGIGVVFSILIVFFTGMLVTNFIGHRLVALWDSIVSRIPLVRSVHAGVKQVLNTIFSSSGDAFRQVMLVEYPRKGLWSIAFLTGSGFKQAEHITQQELLTVFVPTTPNPTSGFLIMVPRSDAIPLDVSIDDALKMVISLGVVRPDRDAKRASAAIKTINKENE